jgi:hypothetical protein
MEQFLIDRFIASKKFDRAKISSSIDPQRLNLTGYLLKDVRLEIEVEKHLC